MDKKDILQLWCGMPEFNQPKKIDIKIIAYVADRRFFIRFRNLNDLELLADKCDYFDGKSMHFSSIEAFSCAVQQNITDRTKSLWFPFKSHWGGITKKWISANSVSNRYPVYIVSKGRHKNGLTSKALHKMGVSHFIVVEESQRSLYESVANDSATVISLPRRYLDEYETMDDFGDSKSKGPGAARNFCIDHSSSIGFNKHWVMDDNLDAFHRLNDNEKYEVECASTLAAAEDFVDRFSNVPVAGFNYYSFCKKGDAVPPFVLNTRIYSCLLIDNLSGYRWRGRYNEDTDLSLRVLKDGMCTIQFNAFLCGKVTTQRMSGGNTKEFYAGEGTLPKSKMIEDLHPDVAKVVWKFNRWHHHVNYKVFSGNKLEQKENSACLEVNNYGMILIDKQLVLPVK